MRTIGAGFLGAALAALLFGGIPFEALKAFAGWEYAFRYGTLGMEVGAPIGAVLGALWRARPRNRPATRSLDAALTSAAWAGLAATAGFAYLAWRDRLGWPTGALFVTWFVLWAAACGGAVGLVWNLALAAHCQGRTPEQAERIRRWAAITVALLGIWAAALVLISTGLIFAPSSPLAP